MSEILPDQTNLKSQYASQVANDLERNVKEQERIASELESLQRQLHKLEEDRVLLVSIEQALAAEAGTPEAAAGHRTADTPRSATSEGRLPRSRKPKDAEGSADAKEKQTRQSKGKGRAKAARKTGTPTLRELVAQRLSEQHEARSAAEVTADLAQAHADREFSVTVVRNTLEGLVAKGQALRTKQRRSVFYSEPSTGSAGDAQPQELAKTEV
jgi:hypothetical protein